MATTDLSPWRDLPERAGPQAVRSAFNSFFASAGTMGSPTSGDDLAPGHREALAQLAPTADPAALAAIVEAVFSQADAEFEASGVLPWVAKERADRPAEAMRTEISAHLAQCLRTTTHGLVVVEELAQHRPDASAQLLHALQQASQRLNSHLGWLTVAGGYSTLGLSTYFDDTPSILALKQQDVEAALALKIKPNA
jgi:hypothetical protein